MGFCVEREQWPVGQGGFASCKISFNYDGPSLNFIYDCGARSVRNVEVSVGAFAVSTKHCDALFVSHLDTDHVNGIDRLLEDVQVHTVYLPYLNVEQIALQIAHERAAGESNATLGAVMTDPGSWFGARGVERVVLVRGAKGSDRPDLMLPDSPDRPDLEGSGRPRLKETQPANPIPGRATDNAQLYQLDPGVAISVVDANGPKNWILLPQVPDAQDPALLSQFREALLETVREHLKIEEDKQISDLDVLEVLKTSEGRKKLKQPYDLVYPGGADRNHNRISMSLYSGPLSPLEPEYAVWLRRQKFYQTGHPAFWHSEGPWHKLGWLGTGDAKLGTKTVRKAWLDFYGRLLDHVGTAMLPHHGSYRNFHTDLLSAVPAEVWIAAADPLNSGYGHPHASVRAKVAGHGCFLAHVTADHTAQWSEEFWF